MSVPTVQYAGPQPTSSAAGTPDTSRGPSHYLWDGYPPTNGWIADFVVDPSLGMHFFDDFLMLGTLPGQGTAYNSSVGYWSLYQGSDGGGIINASSSAGVLTFNPSSVASSSQASGVSTPTNDLQGNIGAFQIITNSSGNSALQGKLVFECRVMLTAIAQAGAGGRAAFVGLTDAKAASSSPFLYVAGGSSNDFFSSATASADLNLIGFYNPSSATSSTVQGDWQFVFKLAGAAPVFCSNLNALVSNVLGAGAITSAWHKLGFIYDPNAAPLVISKASDGQTVGNTAKAMLKVFVDGVQAATFLTQTNNILTASFPTGAMFPIAAFMYVGSLSGTNAVATSNGGQMSINWVRAAQNIFV